MKLRQQNRKEGIRLSPITNIAGKSHAAVLSVACCVAVPVKGFLSDEAMMPMPDSRYGAKGNGSCAALCSWASKGFLQGSANKWVLGSVKCGQRESGGGIHAS